MLRIIRSWIGALGICLFSSSGFTAIIPQPTPPEVEATAFVLVDFHSGRILAEKESQKRIDPASLTKMMAVYVVDHELKNGRIKLEDEVPISENAWRTEGSRMFVPIGKKIAVKDLLQGVIIQSVMMQPWHWLNLSQVVSSLLRN